MWYRLAMQWQRAAVVAGCLIGGVVAGAQSPSLPSTPLTYGDLSATFAADGTFTLGGGGWRRLTGTWKAVNGERCV